MWLQQVFAASLCISLIMHQAAAVINSGTNTKAPILSTSTSSSNINSESSDDNSAIEADSVASSSETEANKRESVVGLTDTFASVGFLDGVYGPPIDSYLPPEPSNLGLPIPVYGVPNIASNQVYPTPPPDIPPPIQTLPLSYGVPNSINLPLKDAYGPPQSIHFPFKQTYGPPKQSYGPPRTKYGPPILQRPPKPFNPPPFHIQKGPKPIYGPPRHHKPYFQKLAKPIYGPPKLHYGPTKINFNPPKVNQHTPLFIPPTANGILNPPPLTYGPPIDVHIEVISDLNKGQLSGNYGPPEPIPHGPPHPDVPAPPTPPDITYDGWRPIPGLISQPPPTYGVPHRQQHHGSADLQINGDFTPPPLGPIGVQSLSLQESFKGNGVISDSYGAPLNAVTGSGATASTSVEHQHHQQNSQQQSLNTGYENQGHYQQQNQQTNLNINSIGFEEQSHHHHHNQHNNNIGFSTVQYNGQSHLNQQQQHQGNINLGLSAIGLDNQDNLSIVKSVGYELFPNAGSSNYAPNSYYGAPSDTYTAPPPSSYSHDGPYAATSNSLSHSSSFSSSFGTSSSSFGKSLPSSGVGLIPPSGLYGVVPSSKYGTPLFQPVNNLNIESNQPRHPIVFKEPVPNGLIESVDQKDLQVLLENSHGHREPYIPPVPDVTKPVVEQSQPELNNLYSLPSIDRPISFQNVAHGSSTNGLSSEFSNNFDFNSASANSLANSELHGVIDSYSANLNSVDGAYALPLQAPALSVHADHNQNGFHVDHNQNGFHVDQSQNNVLHLAQSHNFGLNHLNLDSHSGGYNIGNFNAFQNIPHDCRLHTSQPLPHVTYGVPLGYSNNNIGGISQEQHLVYGTPDLQASHSQSVSVSSTSGNTINQQSSKESYGKSLGESFAAGGEVIQSQNLDLNNIPIQGALGSYTLQIQSADGVGSSVSSNHVQHDQVLNEGLLQTILAAIEQPQQQNRNIHVPRTQVQTNQEIYGQITNTQVSKSEIGELENRSDGETEESAKNVVIVTPPVTEVTTNQSATKTETAQSTETNLQLIDDNEIALYFSNNLKTEKTNEVNGQRNNGSNPNEVRVIPNKYGSYVSFKTPKASYVYGDLKSMESENTSDTTE